MRSVVLSGIVTMALVLASPSLASVDLVAVTIEFDEMPEGTAVLAYINVVRFDEEFDYEVELRVNGQVIDNFGFVAVADGGGNCADCPTGQCNGTCKVKVDGKIKSGSCSVGDPCTGTGYECLCSVSCRHVMGTYTFDEGDEVTIEVIPEAGVTELSSSNNSLTTTY